MPVCTVPVIADFTKGKYLIRASILASARQHCEKPAGFRQGVQRNGFHLIELGRLTFAARRGARGASADCNASLPAALILIEAPVFGGLGS